LTGLCRHAYTVVCGFLAQAIESARHLEGAIVMGIPGTEQPVILSAVRTPIGKFMGGLAPLAATELGAKAVAEAVRRAGIESNLVDEAIMGNVVQAGLGQNPAKRPCAAGSIRASPP
jgi:hypothetical protein